jgi:hypothetical protein
VHAPAPAAGAHAVRTSGLSAEEKRKVLWGGKKRAASSSTGAWATSAASALGDGERADRFLALTGAKRQRDERVADGEPATPGGSFAALQQHDGAAAARQQHELFATLERQYEAARGGRGGRFGP